MFLAGRIDTQHEMTHDVGCESMTFAIAHLLAQAAGQDENTGSFPAVAVPTGRHEVFGLVGPAELPGELMVDFEPHAVFGSAAAIGTSKSIMGEYLERESSRDPVTHNRETKWGRNGASGASETGLDCSFR
jgi:hypothetical protein